MHLILLDYDDLTNCIFKFLVLSKGSEDKGADWKIVEMGCDADGNIEARVTKMMIIRIFLIIVLALPFKEGIRTKTEELVTCQRQNSFTIEWKQERKI